MQRADDEPLFEMEHDDEEIQPTTILAERPSPSPSNASRSVAGLPSTAFTGATGGAQAAVKLAGVRYVMSSDTLLSESVNSSAGTVARTPPRQSSSSANAVHPFSPKAVSGAGSSATPFSTSQTRGGGSQTSDASASSSGAPPGTPQAQQQQRPSSYDWITNPFSKSDIPMPPSRILSPQQSSKGVAQEGEGSETSTVAPLRPLAQVRDSFGSAATLIASQGPSGNRIGLNPSNNNSIAATNGLRGFADSFSSSSSKNGTIITTTTTRVNLSPCKSEDHTSPRHLSRTPSAVGQTKEYLFEFEDEDGD